MILSICIPVFNKVEFTKQIIESIKENIFLDSYEILVLDNGSSDDTAGYLYNESFKEGSKLRTITLPENIYVGPAWNILKSYARGDYLLFLNNDITLFKNFDIKLLSYYDGRVMCPYTTNNGNNSSFYQTSNINGTCFLIKKSDWIEDIPEQLKLWYTDDFLFMRYGVNWIREPIIHFGSQTLSTLPEVTAIIEKDREEWIKICIDRKWQDRRFIETCL